MVTALLFVLCGRQFLKVIGLNIMHSLGMSLHSNRSMSWRDALKTAPRLQHLTSMTLPHSDLRDSSSSPLDYAPAQKPSRWRVIRRAILWIAVALLAVLCVRRGPDFLRRVVFLYHQRGCLRYTAAADEVVFDSNPARVAILASDPNFVIFRGCAFRKPSADWSAVRSGLSVSTRPGSPAVLFLHERVAGGTPWLVVVERIEAANASPRFIPYYDVVAHAISPATITSAASGIHFGYIVEVDDMGSDDIRIHAGQSDPADGSRFTIRYEVRGKSHLVEGRVAANGRIEFHHLDG
jgi:hypothetical protein